MRLRVYDSDSEDDLDDHSSSFKPFKKKPNVMDR